MLKKFKKHLNRVFLFYPNTKRLREFKEELLGILMERNEENITKGMTEEQSFKDCIASINDYKETMEELASEKTAELTSTERLLMVMSTLVYIFGVVFIYLAVSLGTKRWDITWLTFIAGTIIGLILIFFAVLKIAKKNSHYIVVRSCNFFITILLTTALYLIVSLTTKKWEYTWITFLIGIVLGYANDILFRVRNRVKMIKFFDIAVITLLVAIILYFTLSFTLNGWSWTWVIYVGWLFVLSVITLITKYFKYINLDK